MRGTCLEHKTVAIHGFFALHVRWLCFWCAAVEYRTFGSGAGRLYPVRGLRVIFQCFQSGFINSPLRFTSLFGCGTFIIMYYLSCAKTKIFAILSKPGIRLSPLQCPEAPAVSLSLCDCDGCIVHGVVSNLSVCDGGDPGKRSSPCRLFLSSHVALAAPPSI